MDLTDRILITGASGFIGTHLARRLSASGAKIVALDLKPPREMIENVTHITGDVRNLCALSIPAIDQIYNLAAVHTTPGHPDAEYYDTNVTGALEVSRLADRDNVREIIFTSSISIYGPSEEKKSETSEPDPTTAYGKSKLMAEKIHENWLHAVEGRKLTVVRPAVVFGQGEGGNFARMAALLKKGVFVFPGRRDTIKSCIQVNDLLDLIFAARAARSKHVVLNGAYPECPTLEQIVTTLQRRYFPKARLIDVPTAVVLAAAKGVSVLNGVGLGIHPERVTKLLKSTYVYPTWAADHDMLPTGAFEAGIARWADTTDHTFI